MAVKTKSVSKTTKKKKAKAVKPKVIKEKKKAVVEKLAKELLAQLKVETKITVKEDDQGMVQVQLDSEDPGMLIGYHGETLSSLQLILAMMVYRQTDEWVKILVNVNDYRERRQESLEKMALSAAQRAKFSGEAQSLPPMSSSERRVVHLALANDEEIETESEGEDRNRRVVIKLKE